MDNTLYILFDFLERSERESDHEPEQKAHYKILVSYDQEGDLLLNPNPKALEFTTKEEMVNTIEEYMEDSDHSEVQLLAVNDFNIGVESCHSQDEFIGLFKTHGSVIKNKSDKSKKSFFSKMF